MGKVRKHIKNDCAGLAQWIGRKVRNHQPMSVREANGEVVSTKSKFANPAIQRAGRRMPNGKAHLVADDPTKVIYVTGAGRAFELSVREITVEEIPMQLVAVGA